MSTPTMPRIVGPLAVAEAKADAVAAQNAAIHAADAIRAAALHLEFATDSRRSQDYRTGQAADARANAAKAWTQLADAVAALERLQRIVLDLAGS